MDNHDLNPAANSIGSGISEADVLTAVAKSGYPLQTIVARQMRHDFHVHEEWSYVDSQTKEQRTLDILAEKLLFEYEDDNQPRIRPTLSMPLECKQSSLPYIFFLTENIVWLKDFPLIAGLFGDSIVVRSDDDPSSWDYRIPDALGLMSHPFIASPPASAMSFSKCVRKGSELELSGSEAFLGLVLPLLKSMQHFCIAERPPKTAYYFDCHLVLGVGVLDAPMIGVRVQDNSNSLTMLPWIRVAKHESLESEDWTERSHMYAIDLVHRAYFPTYLANHVLPFAERFSALALKHQKVIATGQGFVKGMGKDGWGDIEPRLEYRDLRNRVGRIAVILGAVKRFLSRS